MSRYFFGYEFRDAGYGDMSVVQNVSDKFEVDEQLIIYWI